MLLPPEDAWLTLDVGPHTICNIKGQVLRLLTKEEAADTVEGLGPDAMRRPFPAEQIEIGILEPHEGDLQLRTADHQLEHRSEPRPPHRQADHFG